MAVQELPGTIAYLTDAAHLLRVTAPETSAHLLNCRRQLLSEHGESPSETQKQHVCEACGTIMITGQGSELEIKSRRMPRKSARAKASGVVTKMTTATIRPTSKVFSCYSCLRETKISIPPPPPAARRKIKAMPKPKEAAAPEPPKPTANASSKKRAKNRKAGLQALLGQQQQKTGSPLSLANFMK